MTSMAAMLIKRAAHWARSNLPPSGLNSIWRQEKLDEYAQVACVDDIPEFIFHPTWSMKDIFHFIHHAIPSDICFFLPSHQGTPGMDNKRKRQISSPQSDLNKSYSPLTTKRIKEATLFDTSSDISQDSTVICEEFDFEAATPSPTSPVFPHHIPAPQAPAPCRRTIWCLLYLIC